MLNLIRNENMKIYRRLTTWVMIALLVSLVGAASYLMYHDSPQANKVDWRQSQTERIQMLEESKTHMPEEAARFDSQIQLAKEYLAKDISPERSAVWESVSFMSSLVAVITVFTVVVAADAMSGEFSSGTIKLLLIRPVSRSKIVLSKYIAAFQFTIVMLLILFASALAINFALYGTGGMSPTLLDLNHAGAIVEKNIIIEMLTSYGYKCVELIMIVTLAFMISTLFRSNSLAIGISLCIMFLGNTISMLMSRYEWSKYLLFSNMDLTRYIHNQPLVEGMTLTFSIMVLAAYFLVFNLLTWTVFRRRDVM
ncbi:ABC transporter permease [Paenibacillus lutrae]|uniref:ABC transporter permease subunit n=1 Tax=Paenibacillus lutrae TaxID=2078573 RepID=A0A7X3FFR0_9BACL|nr:ABC transporter permease [Paenibacillus lutrae]MVO98668.1 ABC transporter permease subunit [Paenibacillus lutrae]